MNKHAGDACFKCGLGHFDVYNFVPSIQYESRTICAECPDDEHLHLSCTKCGYVVWDYTAEQQQLLQMEIEARAKLS